MGSREGQVEKGKLIKGGYLESEESLGIDRVGQVLFLRHLNRDDTRKGLYDANWLFMRKCRLRLLSKAR
ncbi:hypothetical protein FF1_045575 [Malus domestica]